MKITNVKHIEDIPDVPELADQTFFFECYRFDDSIRTYTNGYYTLSYIDEGRDFILSTITIREIIGDCEPSYFDLSICTNNEVLESWVYIRTL